MNFGNRTRTSSSVGQPLFPVRPGSVLHQFLERASGESSRCASRMTSMSNNGNLGRSPGTSLSNQIHSRQKTIARNSSSPQTQAFQKSLRTYQTRPTPTPIASVKGRSPRPASNAAAEARMVHSRSKIYSYSQNHERNLYAQNTKNNNVTKPIASKPPISPRTQQFNNSPRFGVNKNKNANIQNDRTYNKERQTFWDQPTNSFDVENGNQESLFPGQENFVRLLCRQTVVKVEKTTSNHEDSGIEVSYFPDTIIQNKGHKKEQSRSDNSERIMNSVPEVIVCGYNQDDKENPNGYKDHEENKNVIPKVIVCRYKDQKNYQEVQFHNLDLAKESKKNLENPDLIVNDNQQCRNCKNLEKELEETKNDQLALNVHVEHLKRELDVLTNFTNYLEDQILNYKEISSPVLPVIPEVTETQSGSVQTDFVLEPSIAPELLEKLKYPLENFISVQYPFINDTGDAKDSNAIVQQRVQFMQIALAARDGLLSELRAKLKKGHKILLRRFESLQKSKERSNKEEDQPLLINADFDFVLNSYRKFARFMYNYIDESLSDLKEFDRINVFETELEDSKYFHKSTMDINGTSYNGIFIAIPSLPHFDNKSNINAIGSIQEDLIKILPKTTDLIETVATTEDLIKTVPTTEDLIKTVPTTEDLIKTVLTTERYDLEYHKTSTLNPLIELAKISEYYEKSSHLLGVEESEVELFSENIHSIPEDNFNTRIESTKDWVDKHLYIASNREEIDSEVIIDTECPTIDDEHDNTIHTSISEIVDPSKQNPDTNPNQSPMKEFFKVDSITDLKVPKLETVCSGGLSAAKAWIERHSSPIKADIFDLSLLKTLMINPTTEPPNNPQTVIKTENILTEISPTSSLLEFEMLELQCRNASSEIVQKIEISTDSANKRDQPELTLFSPELKTEDSNWSGYLRFDNKNKTDEQSKSSIYLSEMTLVNLWPTDEDNTDDCNSSAEKVHDGLQDYNRNIINIFRKKYHIPETPSHSVVNMNDYNVDSLEESTQSDKNQTEHPPDTNSANKILICNNSDQFTVQNVRLEKCITILKAPAFSLPIRSNTSLLDGDSTFEVNSSTYLKKSQICVDTAKSKPLIVENFKDPSRTIPGEYIVEKVPISENPLQTNENIFQPASTPSKIPSPNCIHPRTEPQMLSPVALSMKISSESQEKAPKQQALSPMDIFSEKSIISNIEDASKVSLQQTKSISSPRRHNRDMIPPVITPQQVVSQAAAGITTGTEIQQQRKENKAIKCQAVFSQKWCPEKALTFTVNSKTETSNLHSCETVVKSCDERKTPEFQHQKEIKSSPPVAALVVVRKSSSESNVIKNIRHSTQKSVTPATVNSEHLVGTDVCNRFGWKLKTIGTKSEPNSRPITPRNSSANSFKSCIQKSKLPMRKK